MSNVKEYQGPTVGQSTCSYSQLRNLAMPSQAPAHAPAHAPASSGSYTVPLYCPNGDGPSYPPRYDTFSHGQAYQCGGYFNLKGAYPYADCESCKATSTSIPCTGKVACGNVEGFCGKIHTKEGYCGSCMI